MTGHLAAAGTVVDRTAGSVRIVSAVVADGHGISVPDDALDVRVEPLGPTGPTRVTYAQPLREVEFDGAERERPYVY